MDERGDVGSWIRMACMRGLAAFIQAAYTSTGACPLGPQEFHEGIAGILKQGMERLDNVRHVAGEAFLQIYSLDGRSSNEAWRLAGEDVVKKCFDGRQDSSEPHPSSTQVYGSQTELHGDTSWSDSKTHFPKAVWLLDIPQYRREVLRGLVISIGSKTDVTVSFLGFSAFHVRLYAGQQRFASASLVKYSTKVVVYDGEYTRMELLEDLLDIARPNLTSNNILIPVLQTLHVLLEEDVLTALSEHPQGLDRLSLGHCVITKC